MRSSAGWFHWTVTIPPNTSAIVHLPALRPEDILESEQPLTEVDGTAVVPTESKLNDSTRLPRVLLQVGSGNLSLPIDPTYQAASGQFASKSGEETKRSNGAAQLRVGMILVTHFFPPGSEVVGDDVQD